MLSFGDASGVEIRQNTEKFFETVAIMNREVINGSWILSNSKCIKRLVGVLLSSSSSS